MPTIEDQKPIETFPSVRANLALHVRIRSGRRDRSLDHGHTVGLEHKVGATAVLVIVIVDQEPRRHAQLVELPAHIPGLLVTQAASGLSVTANQITRLVASSIYKRT